MATHPGTLARGPIGERVVTVILGGGRGSRLHPLTLHRAKPAVPLGGKYRLIDIPVSNAISSDCRKIFVLTQFQSASLNRHVAQTYRFDAFTRGFVQILAAEQTDREGSDWFQGTADAVRKAWHHLYRPGVEHVLILSGDHLYRMDYRPMLQVHLDQGADVTVSTIPVTRAGCDGFGVLSANEDGLITGFREKPRADEDISHLEVPPGLRETWGMGARPHLASMGVYVFRVESLLEALSSASADDFGRDILPGMIKTHKVAAYLFDDYWEDIGTISAFFEANLSLCSDTPPFRFWDALAPIYTRPRFLPATRFTDARISSSIVSDGCLVFNAELHRCVIGVRSRIKRGVKARDCVMMGNDYYEDDATRAENQRRGVVDMAIGEGCELERVILDKNARIGANCVLRGVVGQPDADGPGWSRRDGIIIVHKNAEIPAGTVV